MTRRINVALVATTAFAASFTAHAGEIGHFNGGVMNMRDYLVPEPGLYAAVYNYYYTTDRLNDSHGDEIDFVTINPPGGGAGVPVDVNVNVDMYALAPSLVWVTEIERLGIKYGALISPTFANVNLDAALQAALGRGGNISAGSFGVGDLYVQPIWLGKTLKHWDLALAYGFYAPVGKYDTETVTIPGVGAVETESTDSIGYGFWTHQIQGSAAWYPMDNKGTAVIAVLTYETNGKKRDFNVTPGDNLTFNWGISQFLPLRKDESLLLEVGPAGYGTWQITDDSGSDADGTRDQVHAVGGQLGLTYTPWMASLSLRGFYEYDAQDRFQGGSFSVNIAKKLWQAGSWLW
jgi:hypothetical protein